MDHRVNTLEQARDAIAAQDWARVYALLRDCADPQLRPEDLDGLADAAWWLCRVEESVAARQRAYAGHVAAGSERAASASAWMLFYEHHLAGKAATAAGWLARARRHLDQEAECPEHAYLAFAETLLAQHRGDLDVALHSARQLTAIARRCQDADLQAMGRVCAGIVLMSNGKSSTGLACIDEAMCAVLAGELSTLFTGWIYCLALPPCIEAADLHRAGEWTEAAMAWCATLPAGTPFHGICRVHRVEVLHLRGAWAEAAAEAQRACAELLDFDPRVAAEAFYVAGEIHRLGGAAARAEQAYQQAHQLGRDPQPGLALLRLAQGKADIAAAALRAALSAVDHGPVGRSRLLAAEAEVALALGEINRARAASTELDALAASSGAALLVATAALARGSLLLAEQDPLGGLSELRTARSLWLELGLPYPAAQTRMLLAAACRAVGDEEGARLEISAASMVFDRLGAIPDARRAAALLTSRPAGGLTKRETEVLRLLAAGRTNRAIATTLVISEHTVARHVNNIFAKLGVGTRAAATAYAFTHGLV